jgi:hypothetical protein
MVLQGGEIAVRLGASVIKNVFAFFMAMRQNNKVIYGKRSVRKLMKNFSDLRTFTMSDKQFRAFRKHARKYKFPFAGIGDKKNKKGNIDLLIPREYVEPANLVFAKIGFAPPQRESAKTPKEPEVKKKERQPTQSSRDSKAKSTTREASGSSMTRTIDAGKPAETEKPSVEGKLLQFHKQVKVKQATKPKARVRARAKGPKR